MVYDEFFRKWVHSNDWDRTKLETNLFHVDFQKTPEQVKFQATLQAYFSIGGGEAYIVRKRQVCEENARLLHAHIKNNTRENEIVLENFRKKYGLQC